VTNFLITVTLWITGFLLLLNVTCAVLFHRKRTAEKLSYLAASLIELGIFVFALLLHLAILTRVPYHLPRGLPFNRAEIGAAIAIGIGLFPVGYWHRSSASRIREHIAKDAQAMQKREAGVSVRSSAPGEWMN
jgi:hypothetical protein